MRKRMEYGKGNRPAVDPVGCCWGTGIKCLTRVKGGIVLASSEKTAFRTHSFLGTHGVARKPGRPLSTEAVGKRDDVSGWTLFCVRIQGKETMFEAAAVRRRLPQ